MNPNFNDFERGLMVALIVSAIILLILMNI